MLTDTLRSAAGRVYWASPHFLSHVTGKVVILMYHRVIPPDEVASTYVQPGTYVTPDTFERHLQFLAAHFELLTFPELLAKWDAGGWNPASRYCAVTFDDGWIDNYRYGYPLLRRTGVPATIFLPTAIDRVHRSSLVRSARRSAARAAARHTGRMELADRAREASPRR